MKIPEEFVANIRSSILEHLTLLADPDAQREYERNVPVADVPAELVCGWFDDSYHPEHPAFRAAFAPREHDALAEFSEPFTAAVAELFEPLPRLSDLHALLAWRRVISGAASTLLGLSGRAVQQAAAADERRARASKRR